MNWLIAIIATIVLIAFLGPIGAAIAVAIWAVLVVKKSKTAK